MAKKKLDISKAQVADGAQPSIRSVYELVGIKDVKYRDTTYASYRAKIDAMDLVQLHDEARSAHVLTNPSRLVMLDRLEEQFLKHNPGQRALVAAGRQRDRDNEENLPIAERAALIMSRARS